MHSPTPSVALRAGACLLVSLWAASFAGATPVISEFMASNDTTIADQDGDYADWLEIYNPDASADNIGGWYLTDKASKPTKWQIPAGVTVPPGGYLVIFCSEKNYTNPAQPLATNFNLAASGGYVGLVEADGATVASSYTYPQQYPDVSYGVSQPTDGSPPQIGYFEAATPGAANGGQSNLLLTQQVSISAPPALFTGTITVTLTGAGSGQHIRYVLAPPSPAGDTVSAPTAASALYTGPISISSTTLLRAAVFSSDDSQRGLPATAMYVQLDNSTANRLDTFSSNMPLVVFDDNGLGLLQYDDTSHPGWFAAFSPQGGTATLTQAPDFISPDSMKLHGFSSATWPKQSYDVDLSDTLNQDLDEPLLGMDSDKSWDSIGPWYYDRTYIHNAFVYALARQMGHWAPSTTLAEMFIHSAGGPLDATSYAGITAMTDRIKVGANRVNIYSLSPSDTTAPNVTGGYILRIDHPQDAAGLYTWTTTGGQALMLDTPKADVLVQPQIAYITNYVQQMENAMMGDAASNYATHNYLNFLDRPSWVDYHLINIFVENVDSFQYSVYFTKDVNGLIEAGPVWDYDQSLDGDTESVEDPKNWTPGDAGNVFWNIGWWQYLTHDPDFMQAWIDRWQSLRLTTLSTGNLTQLVDTLAAQVGPAAAARDAAQWPDDASRFPGGWQGEIDNLKSWLATRAQWIDSQFVPPPLADVSTTRVVLVPAAGVPMAYTTDGSDPRLSGGAVSASATVTTSPVILPGGTSFSARSYQSSMLGVFPGSPWSSPVATATNAGSVLANLSALGTIGAANPVLYVGFTIAGSGSKPVLLRADGPTLASFNVATPLPDPLLTLYDHGGSIVATNTGWSDPPTPGSSALAGDVAAATAANFSAVGAFALPVNSADCAFVATLPAGVYSAQVAAAGTGSGTALAELYDMAASAPQVHLANFSERAVVGPGGQGVSLGFVISGSAPKTVLIRGIGPALAGFGVAAPLAQPQLSLYDSSSILIATNAGWGGASTPGPSTVPATLQPATAALFSSVSAFSLPANSADCAMIAELPPGAYSAQVTGLNGATGAALIEIYDLAQ